MNFILDLPQHFATTEIRSVSNARSRCRILFGMLHLDRAALEILTRNTHLYRSYPKNRDSKGPSRDKFHFWKQIKNVRGDNSARVLAIKCTDSVVRHEVLEVLKVWKEHFHKIGTPKADPTYDDVDRCMLYFSYILGSLDMLCL